MAVHACHHARSMAGREIGDVVWGAILAEKNVAAVRALRAINVMIVRNKRRRSSWIDGVLRSSHVINDRSLSCVYRVVSSNFQNSNHACMHGITHGTGETINIYKTMHGRSYNSNKRKSMQAVAKPRAIITDFELCYPLFRSGFSRDKGFGVILKKQQKH